MEKRKILIVDDDIDLSGSLKVICERAAIIGRSGDGGQQERT
jgi:hypothetical protein